MAILWYTQKIKVKTKSAKKLIMSDNNNNNSCNSNDDQQSFGSLAEFEGSLSEESKNQFRDAQLIYQVIFSEFQILIFPIGCFIYFLQF